MSEILHKYVLQILHIQVVQMSKNGLSDVTLRIKATIRESWNFGALLILVGTVSS